MLDHFKAYQTKSNYLENSTEKEKIGKDRVHTREPAGIGLTLAEIMLSMFLLMLFVRLI